VYVIVIPREDFVRVMKESPITTEAISKVVQKRLEAHKIVDHRTSQ
jgi:CRP-like cAMP-binding protein